MTNSNRKTEEKLKGQSTRHWSVQYTTARLSSTLSLSPEGYRSAAWRLGVSSLSPDPSFSTSQPCGMLFSYGPHIRPRLLLSPLICSLTARPLELVDSTSSLSPDPVLGSPPPSRQLYPCDGRCSSLVDRILGLYGFIPP